MRRSLIQCGQRLHGHSKTQYKVEDRLSPKRDNLWLARDPDGKVVLIKTAPLPRFNNEVESLKLCQGQKSIRQLLDVTESPQSMVLELLDKNLYHASCEQRLQRQDVKRAVKAALEGLAVLHAHKRAHTDIKPDNLLANCGSGESRFGDIKLGDLGDSGSGRCSYKYWRTHNQRANLPRPGGDAQRTMDNSCRYMVPRCYGRCLCSYSEYC